jgi:hypothetical protein
MRTALMTAVLLLATTAVAKAQVTPGDELLILNAGYLTGTSAATDSTVDGAALTLTYEKLDWDKPLSFGFSIGYGTAQGDSGRGADRVEFSTNTVPFYMGGKYWLGKNKIQGYVGVAIGVYFSWLNAQHVDTGESYSSVGTTGLGLGVPLGGALSIGKSVFVNANYTLNWLWENDLFKDDLLHSFNVGIGLKLGG